MDYLSIMGAILVLFVTFIIGCICWTAYPPKHKEKLLDYHDPNKPFFFTENEKKILSVADRFELYRPALRKNRTYIEIAPPEPINFPLPAEEIIRLKQGLRYVWCDGYTSKTYEQRKCRYLGIRVTNSFILHETLLGRGTYEEACKIRQKSRARNISLDELRLLDLLWSDISAMRELAEDCPLYNVSNFWIQPVSADNSSKVHELANRKGETFPHGNLHEACLLLAVA